MGDPIRKELYVSTDIETNGPIPGDNAMLSIGSAVFTEDGKMIDTFTANMFPMKGSAPNPETMKWWETQPKALLEVHKNQRPAKEVMSDYCAWLNKLPGKPIFVGYPAGFDFSFVYWYLHFFCGQCPFGFSCIDIKSYAMAKLGKDFRETTKRNMPKEWFAEGQKHSHIALEDAIEQGILFCNMLRDNVY